MPPLLAALLMMELGCDLRIVEAIDLGMEWRQAWSATDWQEPMHANVCAEAWYHGRIGCRLPRLPRFGTYGWPRDSYGWAYLYKSD